MSNCDLGHSEIADRSGRLKASASRPCATLGHDLDSAQSISAMASVRSTPVCRSPSRTAQHVTSYSVKHRDHLAHHRHGGDFREFPSDVRRRWKALSTSFQLPALRAAMTPGLSIKQRCRTAGDN